MYRVADKSLARPGSKQATFPAFYGTWRFITTLTRVHHLSLPYPNQSIPLPITLLTDVACFLPGRVKDLSAPWYLFVCSFNSSSLYRHFKSFNKCKTLPREARATVYSETLPTSHKTRLFEANTARKNVNLIFRLRAVG
jgi:hypothetical protein